MAPSQERPDLIERLEALEDEVADVVRGLLLRLRLARLLRRFPERPVRAGFVFVNGFITIALLAAVAMVLQTPFLFPSLGPTAFLLFFRPLAPASSPRNTLCGHALGILCGYGALALTGLGHAPSVMAAGTDLPRIFAAALSLAATGGLMILLRVPHPPAGATTLIVSLGLITTPFHLAVIEFAVGLLLLQALAINRLAGIAYPLWAPKEPASAGPGARR